MGVGNVHAKETEPPEPRGHPALWTNARVLQDSAFQTADCLVGHEIKLVVETGILKNKEGRMGRNKIEKFQRILHVVGVRMIFETLVSLNTHISV